ncbi:MAG: hypothetical protein ACOC5T_05195 [Elusimicrobiota bacterium]
MSDEYLKGMNKKVEPAEDEEDLSDRNARQRRPIKDTVGFNRHGIIPESPYDAPEDYPEDARDYLYGLSRCGTLSGAAKISGIATNRVYKFRKQIEGFMAEEDVAKSVFTDCLENQLFELGLGLDNRVQGMARVKALDKAIKAKKPEEYSEKKQLDVNAEVTWMDLLEQAEEEASEEEEESEED